MSSRLLLLVHFEFKFRGSYAMIITASLRKIAIAKSPQITVQFLRITAPAPYQRSSLAIFGNKIRSDTI